MGLGLALRAFWKAWKAPELTQEFLKEKRTTPQITQTLSDQGRDFSHLKLLALLQQSSRLIDFIKEDISSFTDAQVGAAVRKVHSDCAKSLEELVTIRPILEEAEGSQIEVPVGYDLSTLKLVGKVKGEPPFKGTLVHKGWKVHQQSLPKKAGEGQGSVLCPAEVEIS